MKVLFDTNIVLDVLLDRTPFAVPAVQLFASVEQKVLIGYLCGTTVTTVYYLAQKAVGMAKAKVEVQKLLKLFEIAPVDKSVLEAAIQVDITDFEDAVLCESAKRVKIEAIVTRNEKDFKNAQITIYSPSDLIKVLKEKLFHPNIL